MFYSWVYKVDQLYFHLHPKVDMTLYHQNGVWELVDTAAVYSEKYGFAKARFVVYIKRKPDYFVFTLILPCVLLSVLLFLVYLLPPESGEKVSLQITVLLSFTVFQVVVSGEMPHSSDVIPLMGKLSALASVACNFQLRTPKLAISTQT